MTFWTFLQANWLWILIAFGMFGGLIAEFFGDVFSHLGRALSGRGKNKALKAENKALRRENEHLRSLTRKEISGPHETSEGFLVDIVSRVQATDQAWPQLPEALREDIDYVLTRYRRKKAS